LKRIITSRLLKLHTFFGGNVLVSTGMAILIGLALATAALLFFYTGTPTTLTIAGGPPGSSFRRYAEQYQKILKREGITLKIVASEGSLDNLHKLEDAKSGVDVGFVLGGDAGGNAVDDLQSLGSISYQPLMVFYKGPVVQVLGDFKGKRLALGEGGSGEHRLALTLLKANGIASGDGTTLLDMPVADAVQALLDGRIDGLFFMSESGSTDAIRELTHKPDIHLLNFAQADAYVRRINYLNKLSMPRGAFDFGLDLPPQDVTLLGPMVELIARDDLHPALSDFLIDAARQVHGNPGFFKKRGEFPVLLEHEFKISADAQRYYTSGKSYLYRTFPFWLARLINRMVVAIVPVILVLIPGLKIIPGIYRWRMQGRIYRWYRELLELERDAFEPNLDATRRDALLQKLHEIEESVKTIRVPATFADLFYSLREHIVFVRERLIAEHGPHAAL
jgi:TRAP transporter TAXI family solute receptor